MPVTFSYELDKPGPAQQQIDAFFERLGWERVGADSYRYPSLDAEDATATPEDWFNHIVPALMLFRCYVLSHRLIVKAITLDAHSSTGYRRERSIGAPPQAAEYIKLREPLSAAGRREGSPHDAAHDEQEWSMLADWLDAISFPFGL